MPFDSLVFEQLKEQDIIYQTVGKTSLNKGLKMYLELVGREFE